MTEPGEERSTATTPEPGRLCLRCGTRMEERTCKVICGNCGAFDDCSDP